MIELEPDRRLVLSFGEVRELTQWPDAMVVDYQGILQDLINVVDQSNGGETDLQEQIDALSLEVGDNKQWLGAVEMTAKRAIFLNKATNVRASNLEQLIHAW